MDDTREAIQHLRSRLLAGGAQGLTDDDTAALNRLDVALARVGEGGMALSAEEVQWAYGALQELYWRSREGDDTATLAPHEERLRADMELMLGATASAFKPRSKREATELVRDLRTLLHHEDDVKAAARMLALHVLRETHDEWEEEDVDLWQERMAFGMRALGLFTPEEVRDLLRRFYNRADEEAERVVRTWQEVRRG
jgi:hypothetical protein